MIEGPWSEAEHQRFLIGLRECGRKWGKIAEEYVLSRDRTQVASHAQKYLQKLQLQQRLSKK